MTASSQAPEAKGFRWKLIAPLAVWLAIYLWPVPAGLNVNQWHYFARANGFRRIRAVHHVQRQTRGLLLYASVPRQAVAFGNRFQEHVSQIQMVFWKLHLRRSDVFLHKKQSTRLECAFDLIQKVLQVKNMV